MKPRFCAWRAEFVADQDRPEQTSRLASDGGTWGERTGRRLAARRDGSWSDAARFRLGVVSAVEQSRQAERRLHVAAIYGFTALALIYNCVARFGSFRLASRVQATHFALDPGSTSRIISSSRALSLEIGCRWTRPHAGRLITPCAPALATPASG